MSSTSNVSGSSWTNGARSLFRRAAGLLAIALVLAAAAPAAHAAKKKLVVMAFKGPKASRAQRGVVRLLKPSATLVTGKDFVKASRSVENYTGDAAGVAKVAGRLQAHGIVTGKVSKQGSKLSLTLQILEGRTGQAMGDGITVPLKDGRLNSAARRKLQRELRAILGDLRDPGDGESGELVSSATDATDPAGGAEAEADAGEPAESTEEAEPEPAPPPPPARRKRVASADDVRADESSRGEAAAIAKAKAEAETETDSRDQAVDLAAGASFVSRKLTFNFNDGLAGSNQPQGYSGALVPGVYAAVDLYPAALIDRRGRGFARHIGITAVVDKVLVIKSKLQGGGGESLPTAQTRYGAGLVYRWNIGSSSTSPSLLVGARFNKLTFTIDESEADDPSAIRIPDVSYTYIDPGLRFRLPLAERLAAVAEAHYLVVLDTGELEEDDRYGGTSVTAFDADLGAELRITSSFLVRAGARFAQYGLSFDGSGDLTDPTLDGTQDVTSATDRYLGIYAAAGVAF